MKYTFRPTEKDIIFPFTRNDTGAHQHTHPYTQTHTPTGALVIRMRCDIECDTDISYFPIKQVISVDTLFYLRSEYTHTHTRTHTTCTTAQP